MSLFGAMRLPRSVLFGSGQRHAIGAVAARRFREAGEQVTLLEAGDHVVLADVVYGGTYRFADQFLTRFGVDVSFADASDLASLQSMMRDKVSAPSTSARLTSPALMNLSAILSA